MNKTSTAALLSCIKNCSTTETTVSIKFANQGKTLCTPCINFFSLYASPSNLWWGRKRICANQYELPSACTRKTLKRRDFVSVNDLLAKSLCATSLILILVSELPWLSLYSLGDSILSPCANPDLKTFSIIFVLPDVHFEILSDICSSSVTRDSNNTLSFFWRGWLRETSNHVNLQRWLGTVLFVSLGTHFWEACACSH